MRGHLCRHIILFSTVICCLTATQLAGAAPITFNTALPVAKEEGLFRAQVKYLRSSSDSSGAERELTVWAMPIVGVYGVTGKLAMFGILPVLDKEMELNTASGRATRGDSGIGDFTLLGRYTVWQDDQPGRTLRIAPFAALEMPTGADDETDSLGRLPQPLQLGSGSWDPSIGLVLTSQTLSRQIDVSLSYKFNTEANNFEFGDVGRFDISWQYRLWPAKLSAGLPAFLYGVLESNLVWQDKNEIGGAEDNNSGGFTWHLAPDIQYVTKRTVTEFVVQLPIVQDLNGSGLENDLQATMSFRMNF